VAVAAENSQLQRAVALLLCCLVVLSGDQSFSQALPPAKSELVGKVTATHSVTSRNGKVIIVNDVLYADDTLRTDASGRMSFELQDGSILNMGSDTELSIVTHDANTGETLVNLNSGKLRTRVNKLQNSGKFAIRTPHGTVHAWGTDFFLDVSDNSTELIVYSGVVVVSSANGSSGLGSKLLLDVNARQDVLLDDSGVSYLRLTPESVEQQTIAETIAPQTVPQAIVERQPITKSSHMLRNAAIGGLAAGAALGAVFGLRGSKSQSTSSSTPPTIPAH